MRIVLVLLIALGAAACGKKHAPKAPSQAAPGSGSAMPTESAAPAAAPDSSPQPTTKSDPEEGGQ